YDSLGHFLAINCQLYEDKPAFSNFGALLSYRQLDQRSRAFAAYLQQDLQLKKGDRLALMMPNLLQYPVAMFAALRIGLLVTNINPLYTPRELQHQLHDSGAKAIVILANFAHVLQPVLAQTQIEYIILTQVGDLLPVIKGSVVNFVLRWIKRAVPVFQLPREQTVAFKTALSQGEKQSLEAVEVKADDGAFLQYTGGTTGVAKAAVLSHRNMLANIEQVSAWIKPVIKEGQEVVITALPLYHIFCLSCNCLTFMKQGALMVLITNPRDIPAFIKELSRWPFSVISGVNTLFNALMNHPDFAKLNFSALKLSVAGGTALQKSVAERWQSLTGQTMVEGYGLTECSPVVCVNPVSVDHFTASIGLPLPSTEISIRNDAGEVLPQGEVGELCIRGPQVMSAYWQRPDESEKVLRDGWLYSGDVACVDEQGFVRIVDRKKDLIIVSGFNVYPNEIESVLVECDGVDEAACIGVSDPKSGEAVKVFVVLKQGKIVAKERLIEHCKRNLTAYKVPHLIEFRRELPKNNVGKILRRALRD
ncbi:MAG: AMP-binding protein, partial [Gammaproteobacteria bacterium]|nr:AMP-binding protein [Gammaproteobacteria bacterium]